MYKNIKRIHSYFAIPKNLVKLNSILIAILLLLNICFQAFCIPSNWAIIVLAICFSNTIIYPLVSQSKIAAALTSFISGISLFVFVYCVIFLAHINLLGVVMLLLGVGLVVFIPHFFVVQIIWQNVFRPKFKSSRYFFLAAIILCSVIVGYIGQAYQKASHSIKAFEASNYTELDQTFMTEKILGMGFIYHVSFCEYDGWRPPLHEPILVIGMWLNGSKDPLKIDLKTRLALYKKFFPQNQYKFDCSCALEYSSFYHNDKLWE